MQHNASMVAHESSVRRVQKDYQGPERRFSYRGSVTPDMRHRESLMDAHVTVAEAMAQIKDMYSALHRTRTLIQQSLSMVEFTGRHDRRRSAQ